MDSRSEPQPLQPAGPASGAGPDGGFVARDGQTWYRIARVDRLAPFLVSVASDSDLWMYVTSQGGLTCGRVDADGSLFPYRTVDQLHQAHHHTGPVTLVRIERPGGAPLLWEPLADAARGGPAGERSLAKNTLGNQLVFEETAPDLGLALRYRWAACDRFGWVRTVTLANLGREPVRLAVLDGLRNVLPWGAPLRLYQQSSNLVDAYKQSEVDPGTGLGIFALTAGITDRAEALEVLRANTVWCQGLEGGKVHLSDTALDAFRAGRVLGAERVLRGKAGSYLVSAELELAPGREHTWHQVADVGRDHVQIVALRRRLADPAGLGEQIAASLAAAADNLRRIVGSADGLQLTGRPEAWAHHQANVLFNVMRGGVFPGGHMVSVADFVAFVGEHNQRVAAAQAELLASWPSTLPVDALHERARQSGDPDLCRLALEYLPLSFGRRHGDPSRPWNRFAIRVRAARGEPVLSYEGNWRDIFQNWEALATAFPAFLPGMVARFVNASTVDGFNPYRLTREGVDWEVEDPEDPWSNIGYWGDHQIVYLLKLLEAFEQRQPGALGDLLDQAIFSYADVPYRIAPYADLVRDPRSTIVFDTARAARAEDRTAALGSDGRLVAAADGSVLHVNLLEKLLVPVLAKLSNLVPGAGIWMNTQRPEWNDANNALAGGGVSVVTLCYLRRHLAFLARVLAPHAGRELPISAPVVDWLQRVAAVMQEAPLGEGGGAVAPRARKQRLDALGAAFGDYRALVYERGLQETRPVPVQDVVALCEAALRHVDRDIAANRREDGLYHAYNLLRFGAEGTTAEVQRLPEMLEGQVAALSSGALPLAESRTVLARLFASDLYREDQRSFLLYPAHDRPGFLARNAVPADRAGKIGLVADLLAAGEASVLARDADGVLRFAGDLQQASDLDAALDRLAADPRWSAAVARDRGAVQDLFEAVFAHHAYLGRSGVMYAYEGLGCIYWHMVAKLLLAVQENVLRAVQEAAPADLVDDLAAFYFRVREGIGYEKSVAEYGAFPTDPYSHTPPDGGARQPGMTGQVKEEILTRLGEFGVQVEAGELRFAPLLLESRELLAEPATFAFLDVRGQERSLAVPAGGLAFTLCQVPVVYTRTAGEPAVEVFGADGTQTTHRFDRLDRATTAAILGRTGEVAAVRVAVPAARLRGH